MSLDAMKPNGAFSWNELLTPDIEAARVFYSELLDWKLKDADDAAVPYLIAETGDKEVAGIMQTPPGAEEMPPMWGAYVTVDDIDARTERARKLGAKVYVEPQDIPNIGRFAVVADPQGAIFNMITYVKKD
ncbi:MAG: VOC family protein [Gammaproteobacteria bacterium]|nr:VOC family protein [Gammaproteobacteria bacterium]